MRCALFLQGLIVMLLALRRLPPADATRMQRLSCATIQARLVSAYSHGGIVIDGVLYHATAARGLHKLRAGEWTPERWDLFDVGGDDAAALALFQKYKGAAYAWLRLLTFLGFKAVRDLTKMYCFEWCFLAMAGVFPTERMTPEKLFALGALGAYIKRA